MDLNPNPNIFEEKNHGIFWDFGIAHKEMFTETFSFSDSYWVFLVLQEPFKVLQMFTLQTLTDFSIFNQSLIA